MEIIQNPLFADKVDIAVQADKIKRPLVYKSHVKKKISKKMFAEKTCAEAIGELPIGVHVFGLTKGQFSIIDIIRHVVSQVGPCDLVMSTWTAAHSELRTVFDMLQSGDVKKMRMLVDFSFQRRAPALLHQVRELFGQESVRVSKSHAKFYLIKTESRKFVIRTSMNLNFNPRLEDFTIEEDYDLYEFLERFIDDMFDVKFNENATAACSYQQFKIL